MLLSRESFFEFARVDGMELSFQLPDIHQNGFVVKFIRGVKAYRQCGKHCRGYRSHAQRRVGCGGSRQRHADHDLPVFGDIRQTGVVRHRHAQRFGPSFGKTFAALQRVCDLGSGDMVLYPVGVAVGYHGPVRRDESDPVSVPVGGRGLRDLLGRKPALAAAFDKVGKLYQSVVRRFFRCRRGDRYRRRREYEQRRERYQKRTDGMFFHLRPRT